MNENRTSSLGLTVTRIVLGGMMLTHGLPKILNFQDYVSQFPSVAGIGAMPSLVLTIFAEVICSIAIIVGFLPRYASLPGLITMLVAIFAIHNSDPLVKKELPILFATLYFVIITCGGGSFCIKKEG